MKSRVFVNCDHVFNLVEKDHYFELEPRGVLAMKSEFHSRGDYDGEIVCYTRDENDCLIPIVKVYPHDCRKYVTCGQICFCGQLLQHDVRTRYEMQLNRCIAIETCCYCTWSRYYPVSHRWVLADGALGCTKCGYIVPANFPTRHKILSQMPLENVDLPCFVHEFGLNIVKIFEAVQKNQENKIKSIVRKILVLYQNTEVGSEFKNMLEYHNQDFALKNHLDIISDFLSCYFSIVDNVSLEEAKQKIKNIISR